MDGNLAKMELKRVGSIEWVQWAQRMDQKYKKGSTVKGPASNCPGRPAQKEPLGFGENAKTRLGFVRSSTEWVAGTEGSGITGAIGTAGSFLRSVLRALCPVLAAPGDWIWELRYQTRPAFGVWRAGGLVDWLASQHLPSRAIPTRLEPTVLQATSKEVGRRNWSL